MRLMPRFRSEERADPVLSVDDWAGLFQTFAYQGVNYTIPGSPQEQIGTNFPSLTQLAYKTNGVVFACMMVRQLLFQEARFQWRQRRQGRPGDVFGNTDLAKLEKPWQNATTSDLLAKVLQHVDIAGNAFILDRGNGVKVLRPDWVTILVGSNSDPKVGAWDVDAAVVGYAYQPGGPGSGRDPVFFLADEVAHFAPIPDPEAQFRGMSWLTPVLREIMADKAATEHKLKFFENGATPNLVVKLDVPDLDKFSRWIDKFREQHEGAANAYRTMYLGAGADATVVGADMRQIDFKVTQGAGETRVAAAAGVPPVIVGLSEGLQAATYSNYGQARRRFADGTMRPLWRNLCGSLETIVTVPAGAELWYDDSDIPALQEDQKDKADIQFVNAQSIRQLVDGGFDPPSVVDAVTANDLGRLNHTGLTSVQLVPPGTQNAPPPSAAVANGSNSNRKELLAAALTDPED